jgi:CIC family chloride channel protein
VLSPLRRCPPDLRYALAVVAVAVAAGAFATAFRAGLSLVFRHLFRSPDVVEAVRHLGPALRVTLPALGGLAAGLLGVAAARLRGGPGMAEVMEAVTLGRIHVSLSATVLKALASFAAIVSGGSIGREGPLIQFGGASGGVVGELCGLDEKRTRALIAAGAAAGFAGAYNTPIAGVLFVLEIVAGLFAFRVVLPVALATVVATVLTRTLAGAGPLYGLRSFVLGAPAELVVHGAVGALAGLTGVAFMAMLRLGEAAFRKVPLPRPLHAALGGLAVGLIALALPEVTGNGYEVIQWMLDGRFAVLLLGLLLVSKAVATVASVSSGSPGGVFTPSMFLGAALGGVVGKAAVAMGAVAPHAGAGGYVLVGMAATIAATTHAPIMATVLGFELSGDYGVVLPLLLATVLSTAVSRALSRDSIYTAELNRRGIPWEGSLAQRLARAVKARDILEMDPLTVPAGCPLDGALQLLRDSRARVAYVVGAGPIRALDLRVFARLWAERGPASSTAGRTVDELAVDAATASPDATLLELSERLWKVDWGELPIVAPDNPSALLGTVSRRALLGALDRELLQRDLLYTRVVSFESDDDARSDYLELPPRHRVEVVAVPPRLVGVEADLCLLRRDQGVDVLAVRHPGEGNARNQWREIEGVVLRREDRLLVIGRAEAIARFRRGGQGG